MGWGTVVSVVFIVVAVALLGVYWFVPISTTEFEWVGEQNQNSIGNLSAEAMQFYPNMRFEGPALSYKVYNCPLKRKDDMVMAFETLEEKTILNFYPVDSDEQISVHCNDTQRIEEGLFIAGEGGPVNITKSGEFNVISRGSILLLRDGNCPEPNVAIHELLHVLGFDHVNEEANIMYPVSKCGQKISQQTIDVIDTLYSIPSYPDLTFESISAIMHGKYLDVNMSLRNEGLERAPLAKVNLYLDDDLVKEFSLDSLDIGHGRIISLTNIWVTKLSVSNLKAEIVLNTGELKKENNIVELKIKE